jgi:arylsulfatase A-like enzyme
MRRRAFLRNAALGLGALAAPRAFGQTNDARPNVLWIVVEDASPHIGCYGENAVRTPNLDKLASEGVRFESAFVTCPVCSPCRSALATGMYQTTIGSHNHRSQNKTDKAGGNTAYYESYELPDAIPMIPNLFSAAGYFVTNGAQPAMDRPGKTDYNFINTSPPYDGADWRAAPPGTPFFAQIQLAGGKRRRETIDHDAFELPPYYPDDPVIRKDWSEYLASWEYVDQEVEQIVRDLKAAGQYDNTLIAFITDHGVSHVRGKQFLYDEGIQIPMILRFPGGRLAGTVRDDLALHIDLAPVSLAFAGVAAPDHLQGLDLFAPDYTPRDFIVSARDRCDETIDVIRCVRTPRYKYIRNFLSYRPHLQHNQYKDGKEITQRMRAMHSEGALTPLQARLFAPARPAEELYDLDADPFEIDNLADDPDYRAVLEEQRERLYGWMVETRDPGLIPEPILEEMGREHGSKFAAMQQPGMAEVMREIITTIDAGVAGDRSTLRAAIDAEHPATRYHAATWLGVIGNAAEAAVLAPLTKDESPCVQVAARLALYKIEPDDKHVAALGALLDEPNLLVSLYAMNAIEQTGVRNDAVRTIAEKALQFDYDGTQRYGRRVLAGTGSAP